MEHLSERGAGVDFGDLRRTSPITRSFGFERGLPVDRLYIEAFLASHAADIHGAVLEVGDSGYTQRFGRDVDQAAVLDFPRAANPAATLIADLGVSAQFPADAYDCFICTQTLLFVQNLAVAVQSIHRLLRPGGVALITVPGISQIVRENMDREGDFWRFTSRGCRDLFTPVFGREAVQVQAFGNVLSATAFLYGLAAEDLHAEELDVHDPDYELLIGARVQKPR